MSESTIYWTLERAGSETPWWHGSVLPNFLSLAELDKLSTLRFEKRRREWLLGRWTAKRLLKAVVPECAVLPLRMISIENDPSGAPRAFLPGGILLEGILSISHREDAAACAYGPDPTLPLGIDLERIEPRSSAFIADFLTASEAAAANALPGTARDRWAVLCWSVKEAVLKALGIGLRADTRTIELLSAGDARPDGWRPLDVHSTLPGAEIIQAWWRDCGEDVLTLAALSETLTRITRIKTPYNSC